MTPEKLLNNGLYGRCNDTERYLSRRMGLCARIAQVLMPDDFSAVKPNEINLSYLCVDETTDKQDLFSAKMVIRFKEDEIELEMENEQREIERLVYKHEESYSRINSVLVDKIYQDMSVKGFKTNYISTVQAIVITYFAK